MKTKPTIAGVKVNAVLNSLYTVVNLIFPIITYPYVSRILSASGMGRVNFFTSVGNYAILFASLGLTSYGVRAIAQVRDDERQLAKTTRELLNINIFATAVVTIFYIILVIFVPRFYNDLPLAIVNGIWIITNPWGLNWLYSGLEQYAYITKRTVAFKLISLALIFALVRDRNDYLNYAAILVFANVGAFLANYINAHRIVNLAYKGPLNYRKHIKPTLTLFASALAVSVYTNLDTIMLGFIRDNRQVGLYTTAVKAETVLLAMVNALSTVLLPRLSFYISEKRYNDFNRILKKSMAIILLITTSLTIFFIVSAGNCILILGGKGFKAATLSMQILMPILMVSGFSNITGNQILIPQGKDGAFMKAVSVGAIIAFCLNLVLMKPLGAVGGSIATLFAELTQMSIQLFYSRKEVGRNFQIRSFVRVLLAAILAGVLTEMVTLKFNQGAFVMLIIQGVTYFVTYGVLLMLLKEKYFNELLNSIIGR